MSADDLLAGLHDAVLVRLVARWRERDVRFTVQTADRPVAIVVEDVRHLDVPHRSPWGPSDCIHVATAHERAGEVELTIEMQSGDLIVARGAALRVEAIIPASGS